jgi:Kef-type K+ transport system membrane component KefB
MVSDPVSQLVLSIAVVLAVAKLGGDLAVRLGQPSVLGELMAGIALGSAPLPFVQALRTDPYVDMLARVGVLVLLFEVGLEATVRDVARVGLGSARVAVLGIAGTIAAGWLAATLALPAGTPTLVRLFLAAALAATSIGISARVLKDAGASRSAEAHTILGAAVLDDVLGLVVLAIFGGAAARASVSGVTPLGVAVVVLKTVGFLAVAVALGVRFSPLLFRLTARLRTDGALVATGLSLCFVMSWAADAMGLSPIVGAFTAGLVLEEGHSARFVQRGERSLSDRMEPISAWLVPVFFVLMGMRADLRAMGNPATLVLVGCLAAAAVVGKLACALGAPAGVDRLAVAFGMIPRGEVSLVFANVGLSSKLLSAGQYSALVAVVVLTTLVTPVALRRRLAAFGPGRG